MTKGRKTALIKIKNNRLKAFLFLSSPKLWSLDTLHRKSTLLYRRIEALVLQSEANAKGKIGESNKSELCDCLSYRGMPKFLRNFTLILLKKREYCNVNFFSYILAGYSEFENQIKCVVSICF